MVKGLGKHTDKYERDNEKVGDWVASRAGEVTFFLFVVAILVWAVIF